MPLKPALLFLLLCILLCACADNNNPTYPFERSVSDISIVKNSNDANYMIKWRHPIEKIDLQSYYIWIDTTVVKDTAQNASQAQIDAASAMIPYNGRDGGDSLVLTELISGFMDRDSLHIAIWAKYGGSSQGAVQHLYVFFGDDFAPSVVNFSDSSSANTIWINWVRPVDQRDFYKPDSLSGPIAGYNITLSPSDASEDISSASLNVKLDGENMNANIMRFCRFRKEGRSVVLEDLKISDTKTLRIAVIDEKGFDVSNPQANNWSLQISNLKSESSYNISITAWDSAGNSSKAVENRIIPTTDSIAPLIANKFWLYADSGDGLPRLDSNRLVLFWPKSVDPLTKPTQIELDSTLRFPESCAFCRYREIQRYSVEQWNGASWENVPRLDSVRSDYYSARYRIENGSMVADIGGTYVSDTLRWVAPGDSIILRIRAIDNSGHYSEAWIDTIAVSKGALWETQCPPGYMPVKNASSVFCMEKLQHVTENDFNDFMKNVLYVEAKRTCEKLSNTDFSFSLCTEQEWNAACASRGSVYGVIEEKNAAYSENDFSPSKFLFKYCGVRTGNSSSAYSVDKRNKLCISPDGIRDLPGQLQEWVTEKRVIEEDTIDIPLLKGTSYAVFEGASGVELAQCRNRFTPTRIRPKYTTDTVYFYRSGSRIDTLLARDTLRILYAVLSPDSLPDTLLVYTLKSLDGDSLGIDYVNQVEFRRRGGNDWLKVFWQGLDWHGLDSLPKEKLPVLILGTESINASGFFLDPTVGFRCCANFEN
jgi:hypothetical protein